MLNSMKTMTMQAHKKGESREDIALAIHNALFRAAGMDQNKHGQCAVQAREMIKEFLK